MFVSHVEDSNTLQLEFPKTNYAPQQKPIFFDVTSSGLCTTTDAPQTPGELRKDKINDLKYSLREYLHEQFPVGRKLSEIMQAVPSEFSDTCYKNYLTSAGAEKQGRSYTLEPPNPTPWNLKNNSLYTNALQRKQNLFGQKTERSVFTCKSIAKKLWQVIIVCLQRFKYKTELVKTRSVFESAIGAIALYEE